MARVTKTKPVPTETEAPKKTYNRRSAEQIIADFEEKIEQVRRREATKKAKAAPENRAILAAVKAIDKAVAVATEVGDPQALRALQAAHAPLGELLAATGLRLPRTKGRRQGVEGAA